MGKPTATLPRTRYEATVRTLSDRLVEAQRPIRILDAVKWDTTIEKSFFARGCRELPAISPDYYATRPLPYLAEAKGREFRAIEEDVRLHLGATDEVGRILTRMCQEYRLVVDMLRQRGTPAFAARSRQLYGSAGEPLGVGQLRLLDLSRHLLPGPTRHEAAQPRLTAPEAVVRLAERLRAYFQDPSAVRIRLSDGIVADAAAGSDYIKLRQDATFTERDLHVLEVHEGWVHLGTTLNGQRQPICTFLSKGPPSSTLTQEGLAVLMEVLTGAVHPARLRRLADRVAGIALVESGADFLQVYRHYLDAGHEPHESYQQTMRLFRGSGPANCGPFTKDLCYLKGFLLVFSFIQLAKQRGWQSWLPLLFAGKTCASDLPQLGQLVDAGLVLAPRYLPTAFLAAAGLTAAEPGREEPLLGSLQGLLAGGIAS